MDKMTFVVRRAVEEDIPQIKEVAKEAFSLYAENAGIASIVGTLEETYEGLKTEIETKLVLVAVLDDTVVGSVRVEIKPDKTAYLSRFGVKKDYQNNGIGKILMNAVDNAMEELGVTNLYLHTASRMLSLVKFYYGRGFYIESTTKDRGYIRALLCKEYKTEIAHETLNNCYENLAVV
ncbi:GNAT family N-acetyltransferase [Clostridium sp. SYSU_GA19001]|uniref:GNAT family N-acetyltransferase n=1 Tax=Clostridium caldaquaticum TaxID=2940653 RepID=UPI002076D7A4|nr:GNAT family N-acetyltransferase [Clostridium caldaquaticum]MCM8710282.1 GNAT family N-acetyltransferase [Clostridium caldaquaticum]